MHHVTNTWGGGVAQFAERQAGDSMASVTGVQTPPGAQEKCVNFFWVKMYVVLTRSQCAQPLCVYARTKTITFTLTLKIL